MRSIPYFVLFLSMACIMLMFSPTIDGQYGIYASSDQVSYDIGDTVILEVEVTEPSMVTFQIENGTGSLVAIRTILVDQEPSVGQSDIFSGEYKFKLSDDAEPGAYRYFISAIGQESDDGPTSSRGMITDTFTVLPPPSPEKERTLLDTIPAPIIGAIITISLIGILWASEQTRFLLLTWIILPLYTRMKKDIEQDIVQQNNRGRIYQHIKENPGTTLTSIMSSVETGNGTTVYHLNMLEKTSSIVKYSTQYYIRGTIPNFFGTMKRQLKDGEKLVVSYLMNAERATEMMIGQSIRLSQSSTNRTMKRLLNAGVLVRTKENGVFTYSISMKYRYWLHKLREEPSENRNPICLACHKEITVSSATFCPYCSTNLKAHEKDY